MRSLGCILVIGVLAGWGCSNDARDRLAHFFFEIPETPAGTVGQDQPTSPTYKPPTLTLPSAVFVSSHPPYVERSCRTCHDPRQRMHPRENFLDACQACHKRYFSDEVGHFPVQQKQCIECHDMHRSREVKLLKYALPDLCIECHEEPEDLTEENHDVDSVEDCLSCHDPHFGTTGLLKRKNGGKE